MPKIKTSKVELIQKSLIVFKINGYSKTSISKLAEACNIEKAHFYYYFKNKEDLMYEVLSYFKEQVTTNVLSIAYNETLDEGERLNQLLDGLMGIYQEEKIGCLITNTILQTLYDFDSFVHLAQEFCENLIESISLLYQARYSKSYAKEKGKQAVQDMYGGLIFAQIYQDVSYLTQAIHRIKKKI